MSRIQSNSNNYRGQRNNKQFQGTLSLPKGYLVEGYYDNQDQPHQALYLKWAEEIASELKKGKMTSTSLRNFYNEAKTILSLIENNQEESFVNIKKRIYKLRASAFNAVKKSSSEGPPQLFYDFIDKNHDIAVQSERNYRIFTDHFMCIIAYFTGR